MKLSGNSENINDGSFCHSYIPFLVKCERAKRIFSSHRLEKIASKWEDAFLQSTNSREGFRVLAKSQIL